jgi:hypothetical protein
VTMVAAAQTARSAAVALEDVPLAPRSAVEAVSHSHMSVATMVLRAQLLGAVAALVVPLEEAAQPLLQMAVAVVVSSALLEAELLLSKFSHIY